MKYSQRSSTDFVKGQDLDNVFVGDENQYDQSKKEKATPYNLAYLAAWKLRPRYEDPFVPTKVKDGEPKRKAILIIISILMVLIIAVLALSYFAVLPQYTNLYSKVGVAEDGSDLAINLDDIINSVLRKFAFGATDVEPSTLIFYTDCLENIDTLDTPYLIAYYALPVALVLTLVIAIYIFIKGIVGAAAHYKRKKFPFIILLQLLFTLFTVVSGFVWSGLSTEAILDFLTGSSTVMVLGIGSYILLGLELVALILSFFAYKSKKKIKEEARVKEDAINRKRYAEYMAKLDDNYIIGA